MNKNNIMKENDLSNIVLDPEKCKELNDLGAYCFSPCIWWERHVNTSIKVWDPWKATTIRPTFPNDKYYNALPAFTLQELLGQFPYFKFTRHSEKFYLEIDGHSEFGENALLLAYNVLKWYKTRERTNYSLDPKRELSHCVVDLAFPEHGSVYSGPYLDCEKFILAQGDSFNTYKIFPCKYE